MQLSPLWLILATVAPVALLQWWAMRSHFRFEMKVVIWCAATCLCIIWHRVNSSTLSMKLYESAGRLC